LFFIVIGFLSLIKILILFKRAIFGEPVEYDETWPPYILAAITPIEEEENLEKYQDILDLLIKNKKELISQINKLIDEYSDIIKRLEARSNVDG